MLINGLYFHFKIIFELVKYGEMEIKSDQLFFLNYFQECWQSNKQNR